MVTWPGAPLRAGPLGPNLALASCVAKHQSCTLSGPPEPAVDSGPPAALSQGPGTGAASGGLLSLADARTRAPLPLPSRRLARLGWQRHVPFLGPLPSRVPPAGA